MQSDLLKDRSQLFIYNDTKNCPKKAIKSCSLNQLNIFCKALLKSLVKPETQAEQLLQGESSFFFRIP